MSGRQASQEKRDAQQMDAAEADLGLERRVEVAAALAAAHELARARQVRLVPADWTVSSLQYEDDDGQTHTVERARPGVIGTVVDTDDAPGIIAAFAERGHLVVKELTE
jgi:hypothetical protein